MRRVRASRAKIRSMKRFLYITALVFSFAAPQAPDARANEGVREVRTLHPHAIGIGGLLMRGFNRFQTPYVHEVLIDPARVTELLPVKLTPRLDRPDTSFFSGLFLKPAVMRELSRMLRGGKFFPSDTSSDAIAELLPNRSVHTYVLTGDRLTFAEAGLSFGKDKVSKHALIAIDFRDVRYSGQLWREGNTLCFNANSGTFMKKRKQMPGLEKAPKAEPMILIMKQIFEPTLKVSVCRETPPGFGAKEAYDQANKAMLAVYAAQAALKEKTACPGTEAKLKADLTETIRQADLTYADGKAVPLSKDDPSFWDLDVKAADAADRVQVYRKGLEELMECETVSP